MGRLRPGAAAGPPREVVGVAQHHQQRVPRGHHWLTGRGALRYSLAVRALSRAVWVRLGFRDPFGGGMAPSTYDLTK